MLIRRNLSLVLGATSLVLSAAAQAQLTINTTILGDGQNNGKNDIRVNSVKHVNTVFDRFAAPTKITINATNPNNNIRVVQGPNGAFAKDVSVLSNTNSGALETKANFEDSALKAMQDTRNLNRFIDITGNVHFSAIFDFTGAESFNKLLWSERGSGGPNSFAVLTAVDANGNQIAGSKNFLIRPEDSTKLSLKGAIYGTGTNPHFSGTQDLGIQMIDIKSAFNLNSITRIKVSLPTENTQYGNAYFDRLGHGQDFQPDFRLVGAVPEPGTMIALGAGLAGVLARRKKSK